MCGILMVGPGLLLACTSAWRISSNTFNVNSRRGDRCRGTVHGTARKCTACSCVSMTAPSDLNTALLIRKGVWDSTIAILYLWALELPYYTWPCLCCRIERSSKLIVRAPWPEHVPGSLEESPPVDAFPLLTGRPLNQQCHSNLDSWRGFLPGALYSGYVLSAPCVDGSRSLGFWDTASLGGPIFRFTHEPSCFRALLLRGVWLSDGWELRGVCDEHSMVLMRWINLSCAHGNSEVLRLDETTVHPIILVLQCGLSPYPTPRLHQQLDSGGIIGFQFLWWYPHHLLKGTAFAGKCRSWRQLRQVLHWPNATEKQHPPAVVIQICFTRFEGRDQMPREHVGSSRGRAAPGGHWLASTTIGCSCHLSLMPWILRLQALSFVYNGLAET